MTETRSTRAFASDLEIRGSDGRTIVGLAAPFGVPTEINDYAGQYTETIERGAFTRTIAERGDRVKLLALHDYKALPIGKATSLREDAAGLYGEFRVSATHAGDEVLELVRDGSLDGLSIGFRTVRDSWSADRRERSLFEVRLEEVSVVNFPAYDTARVLAVRSEANPTPLLSAAQRQLDLLGHVPRVDLPPRSY